MKEIGTLKKKHKVAFPYHPVHAKCEKKLHKRLVEYAQMEGRSAGMQAGKIISQFFIDLDRRKSRHEGTN